MIFEIQAMKVDILFFGWSQYC